MAPQLAVHPKQPRNTPAEIPIVSIAPFHRAYEAKARDLLVQCLSELAAPSLRHQLGPYLARALNGDYRDIAEFYRPGRGSGFWLALSKGGDLLGTFALLPAGEDDVELRRMFVDARCRRQGVARTMLAHAESLCKGWGFRRLFLSTSTLSQAAVALYRSAGYRESEYTGAGPGVPLPPGVQALTFETTFGSPAAGA